MAFVELLIATFTSFSLAVVCSSYLIKAVNWISVWLVFH